MDNQNNDEIIQKTQKKLIVLFAKYLQERIGYINSSKRPEILKLARMEELNCLGDFLETIDEKIEKKEID